ncbi:hypothetical protein, partial [Floridanema evergladense]
MIVASLALEERHGEASKQVKMPHQYSGKFFAKTKNKSQNHQNSNLHHLYIASILTKLQVIYDAMVWKVIITRFRNWIASIYIQEAKERDAISDRLNGTQRERSIHDAITQQPQSIYDATEWRSITPGFKNQTQKSRSIYDVM